MKIKEFQNMIASANDEAVGEFGTGFAIQCSEIFRQFCKENSMEEKYYYFEKLITSIINNHHDITLEIDRVLFDHDEFTPTFFSDCAASLSIYCFEHMILRKGNRKNIEHTIIEALHQAASYIRDDNGVFLYDEIEIPKILLPFFLIHIPTLEGRSDSKRYYLHCDEHKLPMI